MDTDKLSSQNPTCLKLRIDINGMTKHEFKWSEKGKYLKDLQKVLSFATPKHPENPLLLLKGVPGVYHFTDMNVTFTYTIFNYTLTDEEVKEMEIAAEIAKEKADKEERANELFTKMLNEVREDTIEMITRPIVSYVLDKMAEMTAEALLDTFTGHISDSVINLFTDAANEKLLMKMENELQYKINDKMAIALENNVFDELIELTQNNILKGISK